MLHVGLIPALVWGEPGSLQCRIFLFFMEASLRSRPPHVEAASL